MEKGDRYRGCLLGLAVGDALGTPLEFCRPGTFEPVVDLVGGGPFSLKPGQWTDDTSMALCLAESLIEKQGFDPIDQLERYVRWYKTGYLSSTGTCFDIGTTVHSALVRFEKTREPYCGLTHPRSAGNGSIMRLAPIPLFYANHPLEAMTQAAESSRTTHGALTCVDACRLMAGIIVGAIQGVSKETLLSPHYCPIPGYWETHPLVSEIDEIARGSYRQKQPPAIRGTGYVVESLEAALWAFDQSDSFAAGCLLAVNLGDDADTTGAVYGQIAGAFYGVSGIPSRWLALLHEREMIEGLAVKLKEVAA